MSDLSIQEKPNKQRRAPIVAGTDDDTWLNVRQVCGEVGLRYRQSLTRWRDDPKLNFPAPTYLNGLCYWTRGSIRTWKQARATVTVVKKSAKTEAESAK